MKVCDPEVLTIILTHSLFSLQFDEVMVHHVNNRGVDAVFSNLVMCNLKSCFFALFIVSGYKSSVVKSTYLSFDSSKSLCMSFGI